jgi:tetratricopeptide (TPR) repeat protein
VLLSSLVSKSLLRYYKNADHYDFHELIRQYASAQLHAQPEDEQRLRMKHSQYYAGWVADLEKHLKGPQQMEISRQILSETANWSFAWQWAANHQRLDMLRQMLTCLAWYFEIHSYYEDALSFVQSAVNKLRAAGMPGTLNAPFEKSAFASLTNQLGWVIFRMGNLVEAVTIFKSSLELAHETGDQETLFYIHNNWAYLALLNGDVNEAKRLTLESLANAHQLGSQWHIAIPITMLGNLEYLGGNLDESYRQLQDSLEIWRAVGDPRGLIFCMLYLVTTLFAMGDLDSVETILEESYAISKDKHDRWAQSVELDLLGQVFMLKGQIQNGRELFQQSLALSHEIGDQWGSTQTLIHLGEAQAALHRMNDAKQMFREAYLKAQQGKWAPTALEALIALASIDHQMPVETRLGIALSVLSHSNTSPPTHQRATQLQEQLLTALNPQQVEMSHAHAAEINPLNLSFPL